MAIAQAALLVLTASASNAEDRPQATEETSIVDNAIAPTGIMLTDVQLDGVLGRRFDNNIEYLLWRYRSEADRRLFPFEHREEWSGKRNADWDGEYAGKWLDAATLAADVSGNEELLAACRAFATRLREAQTSDGYLGTLLPGDRQKGLFPLWVHWLAMKSLRMYGQHLDDQACIDAAVRGADWLVREFEPIEDGANPLYAISTSTLSWLDEMAEAHKVAGETRYLDFANTAMVHCQPLQDWLQSGKAPYTHAYHLMTYLGGAVMVADARGDKKTLTGLADLWDDIARKHLFPTASMTVGERLGMPASDVPEGSLQETCATVEWMFYTQRMHDALDDVRYKNMLERTMRNALLGAQKADGMGWTYHTPLRSRKQWLHGGTECCFFSGPRGVARLPLLTYDTDDEGIRVDLFESSRAQFEVHGHAVTLTQDSAYPAQGKVSVRVDTENPVSFVMRLRVPEHTGGHQLRLNGEPLQSVVNPGEYLMVSRAWAKGDTVTLEFMPEVWLFRMRDGNATVMRGVEALAADQRDNKAGLDGLRIQEPVVLEPVPAAAGGRPRYRAMFDDGGAPGTLVLTPFGEAGNAPEDDPDAETLYRTAFPAGAPVVGRAQFTGARMDVDGRLWGPGVTYQDGEIVVDAWDKTGAYGYMQALVGGAPLVNHGRWKCNWPRPVHPALRWDTVWLLRNRCIRAYPWHLPGP